MPRLLQGFFLFWRLNAYNAPLPLKFGVHEAYGSVSTQKNKISYTSHISHISEDYAIAKLLIPAPVPLVRKLRVKGQS